MNIDQIVKRLEGCRASIIFNEDHRVDGRILEVHDDHITLVDHAGCITIINAHTTAIHTITIPMEDWVKAFGGSQQ